MAIERPPTNLAAERETNDRLQEINPVAGQPLAIVLVVDWVLTIAPVVPGTAPVVDLRTIVPVAEQEPAIVLVVDWVLTIAPALGQVLAIVLAAGTASVIAASRRVPVTVPVIIPSVVVVIAEATPVPAATGEVRAWGAADLAAAGAVADSAVAAGAVVVAA